MHIRYATPRFRWMQEMDDLKACLEFHQMFAQLECLDVYKSRKVLSWNAIYTTNNFLRFAINSMTMRLHDVWYPKSHALKRFPPQTSKVVGTVIHWSDNRMKIKKAILRRPLISKMHLCGNYAILKIVRLAIQVPK